MTPYRYVLASEQVNMVYRKIANSNFVYGAPFAAFVATTPGP